MNNILPFPMEKVVANQNWIAQEARLCEKEFASLGNYHIASVSNAKYYQALIERKENIGRLNLIIGKMEN